MIINNFDVVGVTIHEPKADSPWPIDGDGPLATSVALQRMQPNALERADLVESLGCVQHRQQLQRRIHVEAAPPRFARLEQPPGRRIAPRTDHLVRLLRLAYYVKWSTGKIHQTVRSFQRQGCKCLPVRTRNGKQRRTHVGAGFKPAPTRRMRS